MTDQDDEQLAAQAIEVKDYEEAVRLLRLSAERNSAYALLSLGWIYETGATGSADKNAARSYYERAAAQGSATAYLYLGWLLLEQGEESQARAAFEGGARLNNDNNECKLALARLNEKNIEQLAAQAIETGNYEEAVTFLRPFEERNSEYALLSLGWIYETGAIGSPDKNSARLYYERAVAQGSASASFELGRLLLVLGEESRARTAFSTGAEQGYIPCMSKLGRMMVEGRGGPIDNDTGSAWLEKAAMQGHILAQRTLLGIAERNAKSMLEKFAFKIKVAFLAKKGAREMLKDPQSDKVR